MGKKLLACLLIAASALSLTACGSKKLDKDSLPPLPEENARPAAQAAEPAAQTGTTLSRGDRG